MEQTKRNRSVWQAALIGIKLLLICAIVAGIVSFVYALTESTYEKNIQQTKNQAIGEIFEKDGLTCEVFAEGESGEVFYVVFDGNTPIGYCAEVASGGFGGDISLMVGYDNDCAVLGVSVIAHSETPGLGAKILNEDFLAQYEGQSGEILLGEDVDAIVGATISSRAVTDGINRATEGLLKQMDGVGGEAE